VVFCFVSNLLHACNLCTTSVLIVVIVIASEMGALDRKQKHV